MDKSSLNKFFLGECTATERKAVLQWLSNSSNDAQLETWISEHLESIKNIDTDHNDADSSMQFVWSKIQEKITEGIASSSLPATEAATLRPVVNLRNNFNRLLSIAAILVLMLSGLVYLLVHPNEAVKKAAITASHDVDIAPPKSNKATLTLGNGKQITIDNSVAGELAKEGEVEILKSADGAIAYSGNGGSSLSYNTLSIPKGSKPLRLSLSDGSLVWLNAASSITYLTAFAGNERIVKVTGEAYFEVAKNASMPFYVRHDDAVVKVLGTHFNVNTYDDEQEIKVTLLEGSVQVRSGTKNGVLKPGEQATLVNGGIIKRADVDLEEVMSWKNGLFYFNGADIKSIMRQIEKYYDVEVVYQDNVNYQFYAKIDRGVNVSDFLKKLELTNLVHFKIESKKITVMK